MDDIGLDLLITTYKKPGGDPLRITVPIPDSLTFSITSREFMDESGLYLVSAQAVDNSGQSSEVVFQDFHVLIQDGGQDRGWGEGLLGGFAPILPDLGEVDFPEIRPQAIDDGCLHLSAVEGPMWISLRLAVTCRFEAPPGKVIQFDFEESINPDQGEVSPPGPDWNSQPPRTTLLPGDTFSYLRPSPKCWKKYNYKVGVSYENVNTLEDGVFNPNVSITETSIETLPCEESVDESFNFVVSDHEQGYSVYWNIPKLAELYQEPNPLEIRMEVQRYSLDLRESETLVERTITRDDIFPIIDEYIDEVPRCREQYYYRLVLSEADTGRVKQTIVKKAPEKFCLVGGAREFVLSIPQLYAELADGTSYLSSYVDFWIPRDWPYQFPNFLVLDFDPGPQIVYRVGYIWNFIEAYNSYNDRVDYIDCGGLPYRAQLMVARGSLGDIAYEHRSEDIPQEDILDKGSMLHLISLPCLPMGPEHVILHATNCDDQPCIKVNWEQALPPDALQRFQADSVLLVKQTFSPDGTHGEVPHTLEHFQTEFLDPKVTPGLTYIYKIYYEFDGHHGPGLEQSIVPPTGEQWDCIVDSPENYRCE